MKTMYNVYHHYDVDGGFGDAVSQMDLLFTTDSKEVADSFVSKYDNNHVYDIPYARLYRGALRIEEVAVVSRYEDIPQRLIQWGEENIKCEDFDPSDWSLPEGDYLPIPDEGWEPDYNMEEDESIPPFATREEEIEEIRKSAEFPKVTRGEMEDLLKYTKWKHTPWHKESAYYTLEDIVQDIQEVARRLEWGEAYSNIGDQRERLIHNGVLDGGMVGERVAECKFEFEGMLFCISTEADGVVVGFYPADSGNLAPFADEVWCIFYSDEDKPRKQRIKKARS